MSLIFPLNTLNTYSFTECDKNTKYVGVIIVAVTACIVHLSKKNED